MIPGAVTHLTLNTTSPKTKHSCLTPWCVLAATRSLLCLFGREDITDNKAAGSGATDWLRSSYTDWSIVSSQVPLHGAVTIWKGGLERVCDVCWRNHWFVPISDRRVCAKKLGQALSPRRAATKATSSEDPGSLDLTSRPLFSVCLTQSTVPILPFINLSLWGNGSFVSYLNLSSV